MPLRTFFEISTIAGLAEWIFEHQSEQLSAEQIATMADDIKSLSEAEIQELLKAEKEGLSENGQARV
jgi:phage host-nuclease inhibitor protein Gam